MIAYILDGRNPETGVSDPRMARLKGAGPWQYQLHSEGCMAVWRSKGPVKRAELGEQRPTTDGMIYIGPKELPKPDQLLHAQMRQREDLTEVPISLESGETIRIMPAYLSPRQIMEDNTTGDYTTMYGRSVRKILDKSREKPGLKINDCVNEITECCRLAIMYTYRMTRELLQDLGWLNEDSILAIWEATVQGPKAEPKAENGS